MRHAVHEAVRPVHPLDERIAGVSHVMWADKAKHAEAHARNAVFYGDKAIDRAMAARGRIMQHAHIGFRSVRRTVDAIAEVHETCARRGVAVDRFGITLYCRWAIQPPAAPGVDGATGSC